MISSGVKTDDSDAIVTNKYVNRHIQTGIDALKEVMNNKESIKHLRF